jgi:hypothetical protein
MFKTPAGAAVAVFTLLLIGWLLSNATWADARDSLIAAAVGLAIYAVYQWARHADPSRKPAGSS